MAKGQDASDEHEARNELGAVPEVPDKLSWPKLKYVCVVLVLKDFDRNLGFMLRQLAPRAAEIVLLLVKTGSRRFCEDHSGRIQVLSSLQDQAVGIFSRNGNQR